jgi:hypothetical protein
MLGVFVLCVDEAEWQLTSDNHVRHASPGHSAFTAGQFLPKRIAAKNLRSVYFAAFQCRYNLLDLTPNGIEKSCGDGVYGASVIQDDAPAGLNVSGVGRRFRCLLLDMLIHYL